MSIRRAETEADLAFCAEVANAVEQQPIAVEQLARCRDRLLLHPGGGYAYVDRSSVEDSAYAMVRVHPRARGQGIGSELVEAAKGEARELGNDSAWGRVLGGDEGSLQFATARGFAEVSREVELRRRLTPGEGSIAEGIVELSEDHREGAYAVAVEALPDMVTAGQAGMKLSFEEWVEEELSGPVAFAALDRGEVVGYATFYALPATPTRLEHGLTAVRPGHRRRGLATALGQAQIAWAAAHGYEELVTTTGVANTPLRRQKAKLGYAETPGPVLVRGPV
jgi:mycothiol synthase